MSRPSGLRIEQAPETDAAPSSELAALEERLCQYNAARTGYTDGRARRLMIRDADQALIGGLLATTWAGWLDIRLLWIDEAWRRRGLGSELLRAAEAAAVARGCRWATVDTHSFQAAVFYQRHGYSVYATLDSYPPGYDKQFLKRFLLADPAP